MNTSLGMTLKALREARGLTLRELERLTDLSSGYLSLLEHDKVKHPNPSVLYHLADALGASYGELMQRAGYPALGGDHEMHQPSQPVIAFKGAERLTQQQQQEVQDFIDFKLRQRRQRDRGEDAT